MKKNLLLVLLICCCVGLTYSQQRTVKGKVTDGKNPIEDVVVRILDKDGIVTNTDKTGFYEIAVSTGDKIEFKYMGMKTVTILVEEVTRILNPILIPEITELDEVVVRKSRRKSQADLAREYKTNTAIIKTAYGYLNAHSAPGGVRMMSEDQIIPGNLCVLNLLRNYFPGVSVQGDCFSGGTVYVRGFNSFASRNGAIFDIDGLIVVEAPIWLDLANIKRIAVLNNLANTVKYGGLGNGGVIVINTIAGNHSPTQVIDYARLKNNFYQGDALGGEKLRVNWPTYKKELYASTNLDEAKMVYQKYAPTYSNSPYFFMDVKRYFDEIGDEDFSERIVADNFRLFDGNPVLLKALAYQYEAQGNHASANELYKEVFLLRPNYAQSYLDMANSYRDLVRPQQAAAIYARYGYLVEKGFMEQDTVMFAPIMNREFNNLLALERDAVVKTSKRNKLYVAEEDFKGTRLVFEWNDSEAEFDLQFVNPENQYHIYKHSLADNDETIERNKEFGYSITEEFIDEALPGTWLVNIKYHGNKSLTPTYLKATVYHNYGEVSQRKEVKVFKLTLKDVNQELFRVQTAKGIVMR
ncbi:Putative outer membrane protein [Croceitalea dokdonensis DOKDO 023]|uniref:Putative outer membrane protein n=1 Tax=Croceitalea dokdonensis DOKDO 023 TaxID=1300341 RepID=A0A0N8H4F5_9FLAO|nr:hypothetical protein [Croceitalea dokdonensis]KPM33228.1 Putative outer membrane protein [Croceitalea dokdonensis DOKDO 023]